MITTSKILAEIGESLKNTSEGIDAILEIVKQIAHQNEKVPIEKKPLLNLHEAQQYSGLSRKFLLQAITENRLKGEVIGKAWRVRRRDLEKFLEGDKGTLSYTGQNFEKMVKTKNREHFCGSPGKIC